MRILRKSVEAPRHDLNFHLNDVLYQGWELSHVVCNGQGFTLIWERPIMEDGAYDLSGGQTTKIPNSPKGVYYI